MAFGEKPYSLASGREAVRRGAAAIAGIALTAFCLALAACSGSHGAQAQAAAMHTEAPPRAVHVARVETRLVAEPLDAPGVLNPREEVAVNPEVAGYRVISLLADESQPVRAGQPLAILDGTLLRENIAEREALVAQQKAAAALSKKNAERALRLKQEGFLAQAQVDERLMQADADRAGVEAQFAQLQTLRVDEGKLVVRSPVNGLVLERRARIGDISAPTEPTPMFRIARDSAVELYADLPERTVAAMRTGQPVTVLLTNGVQVEGTVRLVGSRIDPRTKLGAARIALPVRADIKAGGFARAMIPSGGSPAPAVPEAAIRYNSSGPTVMVVGPDRRVVEVRVRTGRRANGWVELVQGPPPGATVVLGGSAFVLAGDRVQPTAEVGLASAASTRSAP